MCYENIDSELKDIMFSFFYRFSRFEFCLKRHDFCDTSHNRPKADWQKFVCAFSAAYAAYPASCAAKCLLNNLPNKEMINSSGKLSWEEADFAKDRTELGKVIDILNIIRNNLFHGGKYGNNKTNEKRNKKLLVAGKKVLDELVDLAGTKTPDFRINYKEHDVFISN